MAIEDQLCSDVEHPGGVYHQRADGLAGKQQRVAGEEADASENYGDIAEEQKSGRSPKFQIDRQPKAEPDQRGPAHPCREGADGIIERGHADVGARVS
jgi:hypothetical protein